MVNQQYGPLLAMAIGDAYGAGFEFVDPEIVSSQNHLRAYFRHPRWKGDPGRYTDDTQMALALALLMVRKDPSTWTHYDVARAFVHVFRRDPRKGYSGPFYNLLSKMNGGWDFLRMVRPTSDKSGGAMRAPVLGLLPNVSQVVQAARFQASLTHCTPIGMDAAVAAALMTHYFYYRLGDRRGLTGFLKEHKLCINFDIHWECPVHSSAHEHVLAAHTAILQNDTLSGLLKACVDFTGDVDTVAAIAMPAASFSDEILNDIPMVLIRNLEDGKYGRGHIELIDMKLLDRFPRLLDTGMCVACGQEIHLREGVAVHGEYVDCPLCEAEGSVRRSGTDDDTVLDLFKL